MRFCWLPLLLALGGCVTTAENTFADDHRDKPIAVGPGRLEGRVFEARDPELPLRAAKVTIAGRTVTTEGDGVFVFEGLRDGAAELVVALPGHRTVKEQLTLPVAEVVRIGLPSTGQILVDLPQGADVKTRLSLRRNGVDESRYNGELLDGTYQVTLELEKAGECRWRRAQELEVDLIDGEQRKVDLRFDPPRTLSGEVLNAKKKPVQGAKVLASRVFEHNSLLKMAQDESVGFLEDSRCVTDAFGRFTLDGLEPGTYHLLAWHPEHPATSLDAEAGDQAVKINLVAEKPK